MTDRKIIFQSHFTGSGSGQRCWQFARSTALLGLSLTIFFAGVAACGLVVWLAFISNFEGLAVLPATRIKNMALEISEVLHWFPVSAYSMAMTFNLDRIVKRHRRRPN